MTQCVGEGRGQPGQLAYTPGALGARVVHTVLAAVRHPVLGPSLLMSSLTPHAAAAAAAAAAVACNAGMCWCDHACSAANDCCASAPGRQQPASRVQTAAVRPVIKHSDPAFAEQLAAETRVAVAAAGGRVHDCGAVQLG
jgi:hypothetical protein